MSETIRDLMLKALKEELAESCAGTFSQLSQSGEIGSDVMELYQRRRIAYEAVLSAPADCDPVDVMMKALEPRFEAQAAARQAEAEQNMALHNDLHLPNFGVTRSAFGTAHASGLGLRKSLQDIQDLQKYVAAQEDDITGIFGG